MRHCVPMATTFLKKGPITSRAVPREGWTLRSEDQNLGLKEMIIVSCTSPAAQIATTLCSSALNAHMRSSLVRWADLVSGVDGGQILYMGGQG